MRLSEFSSKIDFRFVEPVTPRDFKLRNTVISYTVDSTGGVDIGSIRTELKALGTGSARDALVAFCKEADAGRITLTLGASPLNKKTSLGRLVKFYQSVGFELTGKSINMLGEPLMIRYPK